MKVEMRKRKEEWSWERVEKKRTKERENMYWIFPLSLIMLIHIFKSLLSKREHRRDGAQSKEVVEYSTMILLKAYIIKSSSIREKQLYKARK